MFVKVSIDFYINSSKSILLVPISCFYPNWIRSLFSKTPSVLSRNKCTHLGNVLWQHVVRDKVFIAELWSRMLLELRGNPNLRHDSFSSEFKLSVSRFHVPNKACWRRSLALELCRHTDSVQSPDSAWPPTIPLPSMHFSQLHERQKQKS